MGNVNTHNQELNEQELNQIEDYDFEAEYLAFKAQKIDGKSFLLACGEYY